MSNIRVIFSLRIRNELIRLGCKEVKAAEPNAKDGKYYVYFFDDTEIVREVIKKYTNK